MHVLIVGAGIGGMTLAALLEQAGVPYVILERSPDVRPIGSAISIPPTVTPVFQQLGVYDDLVRFSQPLRTSTNHTHPPSKPRVDDLTFMKQRYNDTIHIITRPNLFNILAKLVPKAKIHYGKRVHTIQHKPEGVIVRTLAGETYYGDAVIGADGAFSTVREIMYRDLQGAGLLAKEDLVPPAFSGLCLVGVTKPLPSRSIATTDGECRYETMTSKQYPFIGGFLSQSDGSVAWYALQPTSQAKPREEMYLQNVEWGADAIGDMPEEIRSLPCPLGQTMGFLFDNTPRETMGNVLMEEKWYKTWTHGRIALLGDACHKFFPAAGQSAANAMLDAVVLANVLHACPTSTVEDIRHCFAAYVEERQIPARNAYVFSAKLSDLFKRSMMGQIARFVFACQPHSALIAQMDKVYADRPQAAFLTPIPPKGTCWPAPQRTYDRLRRSVSNYYI
ncbi:hypothetical protein BGZ73_003645 [Actinomortierella ambigua]|nr:hypothetical protein BGZ73_003645 [Actinomortierella ambigua]